MTDARGAAMAAALATGCRAPALHPGECPCARLGELCEEGDPLFEAGIAALLDPDGEWCQIDGKNGIHKERK